MPGAEVMIAGGGHQFQHGRLRSVDSKSFTIPFAHVQLRGIKGALLKTRWAFVPEKYLVEFDVEALREQTMRETAEKFGLDSAPYKRLLKQLEAAYEA
jgi:hypothetical protein